MKKRLRTFLALLTVWTALLIPVESYAVNYTLLTCSGGAPQGSTQLFPVSGGGDEGAFCATGGPVIEHIFSWVVCQFSTVLNTVLSKLYCAMQDKMLKAFSAVATLYIVIMGVQMLIGNIQMTARDVLIRLLKLSGVFLFISDSAYGISMAFGFFMDTIFSGIYWVAQAIIPGDLTSPGGAAAVPQYLGVQNQGDVMPVYGVLDKIAYSATIGPLAKTNEKILGLFIVMAGILPPLFGLAVSWLIMCFMIMVRTVISFMLGISAIAFLISLSPIFLSFMLFHATYHLFESWLKYMISYALQIIIVFACLSLWIGSTYTFVDFFNELAKVTFEFNKIETVGGAASEVKTTEGTCPLKPPSITGVPGAVPTIQCEDSTFNADPGSPTFQRDIVKVIPPSRFPHMPEFIDYIVYHMLSLLILAYAFNALLREAPELARQLAGPEYVPILGQGYGFNRYGIPGSKGGGRNIMSNTQPARGGRNQPTSDLTSAGSNAIKQFISDTQKSLTSR